MSMRRRSVRLAGGLLLAVLVVAAGCKKGREVPRTYPVRGTVKYKTGQPVTEGVVELRAPGEQMFSVNADIKDDGTFKVRTIFENQVLDGAPAQSSFTVEPKENDCPIILDGSPPKEG
jgi:hypothetical protein